LYAKTNNQSQAIAAVDQVVKISPHFVDAILLQAELHLKNGDAQSVVDSLSAVVKQSPGLLRAELMLAEAYRALGRLDDAISIVGSRSRDRHRTLPPTFCSASCCSSKTKSLKRAKLLRKQRNWHRVIHLPSSNLSTSILRAKTMRPVIVESMKFFRNSQTPLLGTTCEGDFTLPRKSLIWRRRPSSRPSIWILT